MPRPEGSSGRGIAVKLPEGAAAVLEALALGAAELVESVGVVALLTVVLARKSYPENDVFGVDLRCCAVGILACDNTSCRCGADDTREKNCGEQRQEKSGPPYAAYSLVRILRWRQFIL